MNLDHHLQNQLKTLRLGGVLETLDLRVQQAQKDSLGYLEFFQLLLQDEVERREGKRLNLRLSKAAFEEEKTLEGFDFSANPKLNARLIRDLGNCAFIEKGTMSCSMALPAWARPISPKHSATKPAASVMTFRSPKPSNSSASFWPAGPTTPGRSA